MHPLHLQRESPMYDLYTKEMGYLRDEFLIHMISLIVLVLLYTVFLQHYESWILDTYFFSYTATVIFLLLQTVYYLCI